MTLVGLANLLNNQTQSFVDSRDFITLFSIYARSLYKKDANGILTPWIDENLNPFTGDWISRTMLSTRHQKPEERGK